MASDPAAGVRPGRHGPTRAFAATVLLLGWADGSRAAEPLMSDTRLRVAPVILSGGPALAYPTAFAFVGDDDLLVLEKYSGRVRRVRHGILASEPVLDLPVNSEVGRGLLGIAVQPGAPARVYLFATEAAADGAPALANRVWRYDWDAAAARLENPQQLLDLPVKPGPDHDGGALLLDGAGRLFAVIGDENRAGQLENVVAGPPPLELTSTILRVDAATGAGVPGNPLAPYCAAGLGVCARSSDCAAGDVCLLEAARVYAYGVRNSFGLALDPLTGDLWDTENGPSAYDEVNRVEPGFNSGWRDLMGPAARGPDHTSGLFFPPPRAGSARYSDPEFSWLETIAPTALTFTVGSSWGPAYDDALVVGDARTGQITALRLDQERRAFVLTRGLADLVADTPEERDALVIGRGFGLVSDVDVGPDRHVYVLSYSRGLLYRISGEATPVTLQGFTLE